MLIYRALSVRTHALWCSGEKSYMFIDLKCALFLYFNAQGLFNLLFRFWLKGAHVFGEHKFTCIQRYTEPDVVIHAAPLPEERSLPSLGPQDSTHWHTPKKTLGTCQTLCGTTLQSLRSKSSSSFHIHSTLYTLHAIRTTDPNRFNTRKL